MQIVEGGHILAFISFEPPHEGKTSLTGDRTCDNPNLAGNAIAERSCAVSLAHAEYLTVLLAATPVKEYMSCSL